MRNVILLTLAVSAATTATTAAISTVLFTLVLLSSATAFVIDCRSSQTTPRTMSPKSSDIRSGRDWTNDDFLDSLGGEGGDHGNAGQEQFNEPMNEQVNQPNPGNEMTDEEITEWAMKAAQFYNTDKPLGEVYGVRREGPPRRKDVDE